MGAKQLAAVVCFLFALALFVTPSGGADAAQMEARKPTPTPAPRSMSIFGLKFTPRVLRVRPGTEVTWINGDRTEHEITGIVFRDKLGQTWSICPLRACPAPPPDVIAPPTPPPNPSVPEIDAILDAREDPPLPPAVRASGPAYTYTFDEPGSYALKCTIHPKMAMTVVVR